MEKSFQSYNSPIKTRLRRRQKNKKLKFQSYNSPIKTVISDVQALNQNRFQSYNSPIKTQNVKYNVYYK